MVPNNSNAPSYSTALKGRKSLPNRLSLVNSYDFVIRENCRKCKTAVPNCDSSKLMPLITVAGETVEAGVTAVAKAPSSGLRCLGSWIWHVLLAHLQPPDRVLPSTAFSSLSLLFEWLSVRSEL